MKTTLLLCWVVCCAPAWALMNDGSMSNAEQQNFQEIENYIRRLSDRIKELEARIAFLEENSAEFKLAKAEEREAARKADEAAAAEAARDKRLDVYTIAAISTSGDAIKMRDGTILFIRPQDLPKTTAWKVGDVLDIKEYKPKVPIGQGSFTIYVAATKTGDVQVAVKPWR